MAASSQSTSLSKADDDNGDGINQVNSARRKRKGDERSWQRVTGTHLKPEGWELLEAGLWKEREKRRNFQFCFLAGGGKRDLFPP